MRKAALTHLWFAALAAACASAAPEPPPSTGQPAPEAHAPEPSNTAEAARCPIVPMQLLAVDADGTPLMSLDDRGALRTPLAGSRAMAHLDPRGCVVGDARSAERQGVPSDVWVELTPQGTLWSIREEVEVRGNRIARPRPLEIAPDGTVRSDGDPVMRFSGYRDESRCAALLMLHLFAGMMPSMAVADGNPIELPPPDPSACPDLHAPASSRPGGEPTP